MSKPIILTEDERQPCEVEFWPEGITALSEVRPSTTDTKRVEVAIVVLDDWLSRQKSKG